MYPSLTIDASTLICGGFVTLSLLWWLSTRRPPGIPPGPGPALPLLGHLHLMGKDPRVKFQEWRRQYGDVFSLYMGGRLVVVLNGFRVIKEALVKHADVFSERNKFFVISKMDKIHHGVVFTAGSLWKEQRKTVLEILREMGMGKNVLAEKIQEEVTHYIRAIEDFKGSPFDPHHLTICSVSNNICSIVYGQRFQYEDPIFSDFLQIVEQNFKCLKDSAVLNFLPLLSLLPGDLFRIKQIIRNSHNIRTLFHGPQIERHIQTFSEGECDNFTHAYLRSMKSVHNRDAETTLDVENLHHVAGELFAAGTETTSTAVMWALLYFLHYPDVQEKCFLEIKDVIGTERPPCLRDRLGTTYLEATIMEILRRATVAPLTVPHSTLCDVTLRGYVIPKGTVVLPNLQSVLHDSDSWTDPDNFRPERFIGPDGSLSRPGELIPFGIGRRACLGESLARMELFLYLSSLIQRFRFLPEDPERLPPLKGPFSSTLHPVLFKIRAVERNRNL